MTLALNEPCFCKPLQDTYWFWWYYYFGLLLVPCSAWDVGSSLPRNSVIQYPNMWSIVMLQETSSTTYAGFYHWNLEVTRRLEEGVRIFKSLYPRCLNFNSQVTFMYIFYILVFLYYIYNTYESMFKTTSFNDWHELFFTIWLKPRDTKFKLCMQRSGWKFKWVKGIVSQGRTGTAEVLLSSSFAFFLGINSLWLA